MVSYFSPVSVARRYYMEKTDVRKISVKSLRAEQTKKNILEASEDAFSRLGFYGARIDEIAASAGVNKRMIYEYFGNKEELYKIILEGVYRRLGECEATLAHLGDAFIPTAAIGAIVRIYFEFLKKNPSYVRMVMWENLNMAEYFKEKGLDDIRDPIKRTLHTIIVRGQETGVFKDELDERHILMTLFAFTFNYFSNIYTMSAIMKTDFFSDEQIENKISFLTDMLLSYMCK